MVAYNYQELNGSENLALRRQLCIYDDSVVEEMGYDVATYYKTH